MGNLYFWRSLCRYLGETEVTPHLIVPVLSRGMRGPLLKLNTVLQSFFTSSPLGWKCACEVARAQWDLVALPDWIHAWRGKAWCHSLQCWQSLTGSQQSYWHGWPLVWAVCWGAGGASTACTVIPGKSLSGRDKLK